MIFLIYLTISHLENLPGAFLCRLGALGHSSRCYGISLVTGVPQSLEGFLCFGKSQSKMDDDWGYPYDSGNLHIYIYIYWLVV